MCTLYMLLNTKHRQLCLKYKIDTIKTIRNCFTPPPTSTPTPPPPQSKKFRSGESIMAFSIEGRLCLAPIHPHTCQFHSNVSSKFYRQTLTTIALMSYMRARWPVLLAVSWPSQNLITTVCYEDYFQINSNYTFFRKTVDVGSGIGGQQQWWQDQTWCGTRFHIACWGWQVVRPTWSQQLIIFLQTFLYMHNWLSTQPPVHCSQIHGLVHGLDTDCSIYKV